MSCTVCPLSFFSYQHTGKAISIPTPATAVEEELDTRITARSHLHLAQASDHGAVLLYWPSPASCITADCLSRFCNTAALYQCHACVVSVRRAGDGGTLRTLLQATSA